MKFFLSLIAAIILLGALGSARVVAEEPVTGSLRITQDTDPETDGPEFDYDFDPGSDFDLEDDQFITKNNLAPGTYEIEQTSPSGWVLVSITCDSGVIYSVNLAEASLKIEIEAYDEVECRFNNAQVPTPTPTPEPTPEPTPQVVFVPQVIFVQPPAPPLAPVQAIAPVATARPATQSAVRPPSTGDGGLH